MEHWYAVHTHPHKEQQVRDLLDSHGHTVYLPLVPVGRKKNPWGKRWEPLFARYLFVRLDLGIVPLSSINWSQGVTRVVSFGGQPAIVDEAVIQWLRRRVEYIHREGASVETALQPSERVRITAGPFAGLEAVFDRHLSAEDRARVLIDFLGRPVACVLDLSDLQRLNGEKTQAVCHPTGRL